MNLNTLRRQTGNIVRRHELMQPYVQHIGSVSSLQPQELTTSYAERTFHNGNLFLNEQDTTTTTDQTTTDQNLNQDAANANGSETEGEDTVSAEEHEAKLVELQKKIQDLENDNLRRLADIENVIRIAKDDVEKAKLFAISDFAKGLLEVADNFERANESVPADEIEGSKWVKALHEGNDMNYKELLKVFGKYGINQYDPLDQEFDPHQHQALFEIPSDHMAPNLVKQVIKKGYTLNDRIIRPAQVGVTTQKQ